ncbi:MAG: family 78 glycoside hydrolase catalytic domain [Bacteroidales bacterium]|nr:family 78 glycoside hydrolase catalytic domain [Bacteroidales bacterium]
MRPVAVLCFLMFLYSCQKKVDPCMVVDLRCEYLVNPIGIDVDKPRLSWRIQDLRMGALQQAVQIVIDTDSSVVASGRGSILKSRKMDSDQNFFVPEGIIFEPFTRYYWSVRVWDLEEKVTDFAPVAYFETGMISQTNWNGDWISDSHNISEKRAPYFRKEFNASQPVVSARVYISAAGLYELSINGEKIGDHMLDPMYTRFDRRNLYVSYDVTQAISHGKNTLGVILGNGWYNHQPTAAWSFDQATWRDRPKFCMDLRIVYQGGEEEIISTDTSWKTFSGSIVSNNIYTGEQIDARLEQTGWDKPGFNDSQWNASIVVSAPSQNIVSQQMPPIRIAEEIPAQSVRKIDEKTYLFDFGRNMAGVTRLTVSGTSGTTFRIQHGERLDARGFLDMSNINGLYNPTGDADPFQTDIYILSGSGMESFSPRFNYKGFRYALVTADRPVTLNERNLTACYMHSDVQKIGTIESSNPTLNKIAQATDNSYLSNLFGYPTDCPQREKNGWTGDAHIAIETGLYNFDGITIYEKWMADHRDEQQPNGVLPAIIPTSGWGYHWANGTDWTSTIAIIPWNIYLFYGDSRLLEQTYDNIKRYVNYIDRHYPSGLTDWGLGDWIPVKSNANKELTSSVYYYADVTILAKAAALFNKTEDEKKYLALAEKIRDAINAKFYNASEGIYASGLQTELSVPLYWGVVEEENKEKVAEQLAKRVEADMFHLDTGLLGSKTLLNALSENGYSNIAYRVASQETYPSWGWWIVNGATSLYENWLVDSYKDLSMNHIMFGEIGAWYYKGIGGIFPDEKNPGFKNILLKPHFVEGLEWFKSTHKAPGGEIVSSWKREGNKILYDITIPANTTALLTLEDDFKNVVGNGSDKIAIPQTSMPRDQKGNKNITLKSGSYQFSLE